MRCVGRSPHYEAASGKTFRHRILLTRCTMKFLATERQHDGDDLPNQTLRAPMISRRALLQSTASGAAALLGPEWISAAAAASYPSQPVRWIVPYSAGGATDVLSRLICQYLQDRLGQPFIVENKPGAGSNIGTQDVINSPADGYTLLLTSTANAINASFDPTLPYDFAKGIVPVAGVARIPLVLVVNNELPIHSIADFIAYAKANPGRMSIASSGIGTSLHLSGELFKAMAGIQFTHIPGHVRQCDLVVRIREERQTARARRHHRGTIGDHAGGATDQRYVAGI